jgi:hypothetical protein
MKSIKNNNNLLTHLQCLIDSVELILHKKLQSTTLLCDKNTKFVL